PAADDSYFAWADLDVAANTLRFVGNDLQLVTAGTPITLYTTVIGPGEWFKLDLNVNGGFIEYKINGVDGTPVLAPVFATTQFIVYEDSIFFDLRCYSKLLPENEVNELLEDASSQLWSYHPSPRRGA
ncbi:MAG: hypothetical protein JRE23_16070, partial [Deltaproteobacteria bacterium]|nr:hypothetical protein [Deltaproteobacteria bacterium]